MQGRHTVKKKAAGPTKAKKRPPRTPGVMNATEKRFEANVLKPLLWAGEIESYDFEPMRFRYGSDQKATYTPDFRVIRADGCLELIDVKGSGGWEPATRVKMKACAEKYQEFYWVGYVETSKRGEFVREDF